MKKLKRNGVNTNSEITKQIVDQIIVNLKSLEKLNKKEFSQFKQVSMKVLE